MRCSMSGLTIVLFLGIFLGPLAAQQAAKIPRIGYLSSNAPETFRVDAFRQALQEFGWVEGQNLLVDYRSADGQFARLPELAAELVRLKVDVIVAVPTVSALAAQQATRTIPVVFTHVSDPVGSGLVPSLAQPGGNITGFTHLNAELSPKRLAFLTEAMPNVTHIAALWHPGGLDDRTQKTMVQETEDAARSLGVQLQFVAVRGPGDFDEAFAAMTSAHTGALIVLPGPLLLAERRRIVDLAAQHHLPAVYFAREFVEAGGLMAYGANMAALVQGAARSVDKILKGAKPADLPVEQAARFELLINLKTAQALGLSLPPTLLFQATEVIQ